MDDFLEAWEFEDILPLREFIPDDFFLEHPTGPGILILGRINLLIDECLNSKNVKWNE